MACMDESRIGELCREGQTVYYVFLWGGMVESKSREYLCQVLIRWANRHRTGDYCDDVETA